MDPPNDPEPATLQLAGRQDPAGLRIQRRPRLGFEFEARYVVLHALSDGRPARLRSSDSFFGK